MCVQQTRTAPTILDFVLKRLVPVVCATGLQTLNHIARVKQYKQLIHVQIKEMLALHVHQFQIII